MLEQFVYNLSGLLSHISWLQLFLSCLSLLIIILIGVKGAQFTKQLMLSLSRHLSKKHETIIRRITLSISYCVHLGITLLLLQLWCDQYLALLNAKVYFFTVKVILTLSELVFFIGIYDIIKCCHFYQIEKLNKPLDHIAPLVSKALISAEDIDFLQDNEDSTLLTTMQDFSAAELDTAQVQASNDAANREELPPTVSVPLSQAESDRQYENKLFNQLAILMQNQSFLNYSAIGLNILLFTVATISILSIWVSNVNGLIAGLSLGGLAFSLAAKDTAANFFGSVAIMLDRPFEVGDWVSVNNIEGNIMKVGIRSTRIKAIDETIYTVPNSILAQSPVNTAGKRDKRRVVLTFNFTYASSKEQLQKFCIGFTKWLTHSQHHNLSTLAVYIDKFSNSSIDVVARFYTPADYNLMCQAKQEAYFQALHLAKNLNLDFAFPSLSVYSETPLRVESVTATDSPLTQTAATPASKQDNTHAAN